MMKLLRLVRDFGRFLSDPLGLNGLFSSVEIGLPASDEACGSKKSSHRQQDLKIENKDEEINVGE